MANVFLAAGLLLHPFHTIHLSLHHLSINTPTIDFSISYDQC